MKTYFHSIDSEHKAYWLGFILADGSIDKGGYRLKLQLQRSDQEHLQKLANVFERELRDGETFDKRTQKTYYYSCLDVSGKGLISDLAQYGIVNCKTFLNHEFIYDKLPPALHHHFIRGYFDGDGCISQHYKNEFSFSMIGGKEFLTATKSVIRSAVPLGDVAIGTVGKMFTLAWGGNFQLKRLREWLYQDATIWLERKREAWDEMEYRNGRVYRGTYLDKRSGKWRARIWHDSQNYWAGPFETEFDAAKAYDQLVISKGLPLSKLNILS